MEKMPEELKLYQADERLDTVMDTAWKTDKYVTLQRVTKKSDRQTNLQKI